MHTRAWRLPVRDVVGMQEGQPLCNAQRNLPAAPAPAQLAAGIRGKRSRQVAALWRRRPWQGSQLQLAMQEAVTIRTLSTRPEPGPRRVIRTSTEKRAKHLHQLHARTCQIMQNNTMQTHHARTCISSMAEKTTPSPVN